MPYVTRVVMLLLALGSLAGLARYAPFPTDRYVYGKAVAGFASALGASSLSAWWHDGWRYRVTITVGANGHARVDKPVEAPLDFTTLLHTVGADQPIDLNSLRLVEIDSVTGAALPDQPYQFDLSPAFNPQNNASGTLTFLLTGETPSAAQRTYHLYFDVAGGGFAAPTFPDQTAISTVTDQGQESFHIQTANATYYYHKEGGGFSSLDDIDGNDWINYSPTPSKSSGGSYRGIPNMVHPEGKLHPGATGHTTVLAHSGPLKKTISTQINTDADARIWHVVWDFFPTYARMTVLDFDHAYWFLYEGTPGGSVEPDRDFLVRSDGAQNLLSQSWTGDLSGEEWVYIAEPALGRALFLIHHDEDGIEDSYRTLSDAGGAMALFGFGRRIGNNNKLLNSQPKQFTIGLMDEVAGAPAAAVVRSAYKEVAVTVGAVEQYNAPHQYTLTVTTSGSGSVAVDPQKASYAPGELVSLTAIPSAGQTFRAWGGALTGSDNPVTLVMDGNKQVSAQFSASDGGGTLTWQHLSSATGDIQLPGSSTEQTAALVLDIDKDGVNDFVIASRRTGAPSVVWYRRHATGWQRYLIDNEILDIEAGGAYFDIDGDGDLDIVMGGDARTNKVWWWENPYPNFDIHTGWTRREVKNSGLGKHHDMMFGDFTGDGKVELVFWNQRAARLLLAEIPADPRTAQPWPWVEIYAYTGDEMEGLAQADVDGDGLADIIGGGRWFKYTGGTTFVEQVIDDAQRFTRAAAGQLAPGGRPEIVFVAGDVIGPLMFYEWKNSAWVGRNLLGVNVNRGHSLEVADANRDGHLDIFVAEMRLNGGNSASKTWLLLGDGTGNFTATVVATGLDNHESRLADLDGDGDLDILVKPYNHGAPRVDVLLNQLNPAGCVARLDQWQRYVLDADRPGRSAFVYLADIDGDGRVDVITGRFWYRNPGFATGAWQRFPIGAPFDDTIAVHDFDGDGDIDLLGTAGVNNQLPFVWARNDGTGNFTVFDNIDSNLSIRENRPVQGVTIARFQPGGPLEVAIAWDNNLGGIQMLTVPDDPSVGIWPRRQATAFSEGEALSSADIDFDGDVDLFTGSHWVRNDGPGDQWTPIPVYTFTSGAPDRNVLADIDGDGDLDVVVGYGHDPESKVAWYEQQASPFAAWPERLVANLTTPSNTSPQSIDVGDMDGDGDLDIVAGQHRGSGSQLHTLRVYAIENIDGRGGEWALHLIHTGDEHHDGTQLFDVDGDGDLDVVSIGWTHGRVLLYENTSACTSAPPQATATPTPPAVNTPTPTPTATATIDPGAGDTPTPPPTATATPTPTATATVTATNTPESDVCSAAPENVLGNPSFESGTDFWRFYTDGKGSFTSVSPGYECDRAAQVTIQTQGSNVQLYQYGFLLEPNSRYRLSFAAYSNSGNDLSLFLHPHSGGGNYGLNGHRVDLTSAWQAFAVEFVTTGFSQPTNNVRLRFWLAPFDATGDRYGVDAVRLEKVADSDANAIIEPEDEVELVENPPVPGALRGQLLDPSGAPVVAAVTAVLEALNQPERRHRYPVESEPNGYYTIEEVLAGEYLHHLEAPAGYRAPEPLAVVIEPDLVTEIRSTLWPDGPDDGAAGLPHTLYLPVVADASR